MKKVTIIVLVVLVALLAIAAILPVVFKDEIKAKVDEEIAKSVNAQVNFDADNFSVSLFKRFPNITATLNDFSVVGNAPFAGDTLAAASSFQITLNLWSVLFGDQMRINRIKLDKPHILVKVLEDGTANYDIAIADSTVVEADTASSGFSIGIDQWEVVDGRIVYDDRSLKFFVSLEDVQHTGNGDFTQDIFDMATKTKANNVKLRYDDVEYVSNKELVADVTMNLNLPESKYTFKENNIKVNDFSMGFDGYLSMPADDILMDISFGAKDNTFKSLLSLVPGMYQEDFDKVKTEGDLDFGGFVKGTYSDATETMPGFRLALKVNDAMFQYPDLPTAVNNIQVDMLVAAEDGNMDNLLIDIKQFAMNMGENPINGRVKIAGLGPMDIDADVSARINLAEMNAMVPMEGLSMRGLYELNLKANGIYDSLKSQFPNIDARMSLQDGYLKSAEYPIAMEQINLISTIKNETGNMSQTVIRVDDMSMVVDQERIAGSLRLENLDDYTWEAKVNGAIDLDKITKIYPLEGMTLAGRIAANIQTKGKMSDLEAERYDQLPTSGTMSVQNFKYESTDMEQDLSINTAKMVFNPQRMELNDFQGAFGRTDLNLKGYVTNYLGFALKENETLRGQMDFYSKQVDLNEFMSDTDTPDTTTSESLEIIEIPKTIDFVLNTTVDKILYDNLTLTNGKGQVIVRNGILDLNNLSFNTLGGQFTLNGNYNTQDITRPTFDFGIDISSLSVSQAFESFVTIQKLAPIAEHVNGDFNTDFRLSGVMGEDMMPELNTLVGGGIIKLVQASIKDSKIISGVTSLTKLNNTDEVNLNDITMQAEIKEGRLHVKPFDINLGGHKATIAGSNGIDGSLDYTVNMNIPAGAVGTAVNNALASLTGKQATESSTIKLAFGVGGTYDNPKIGLAGSDVEGGGVAKQASEAVKEEVREAVQTEIDKAKEEVDRKAQETKDELEKRRKEAEAKAREEAEKQKQKLEEEAKDKLKDLFKR